MLQTKEILNAITQQEIVTTVSYAQSIDGSISYRDNHPIVLSGSASLTFTHELRAIHDGILVGIMTILSDNPSLTVRFAAAAASAAAITDHYDHPTVIVVDTSLKCPLDRKILQGSITADHQRATPIFLSGPAETQDAGTFYLVLTFMDILIIVLNRIFATTKSIGKDRSENIGMSIATRYSKN